MRTYWPMSIPEHGVGLNLTVMSYAGAVGFGFTTAKNAVPDARVLTRALQAAYDELLAKALPRGPGRKGAAAAAEQGAQAPAARPARRVTRKTARPARARSAA
jgi:hypothetical protein